MSDPRWTDETVERVADVLRSYDEEHDVWLWEDLAIEALALLADAGLLIEPGGETRTEWTVETLIGPAASPVTVGPMSEPVARATLARMLAAGDRARLMVRAVYDGRWTPAGALASAILHTDREEQE